MKIFETKRDSPLSSHFGWVGIGTPGTVLFVPAGKPVPAAAPCCPARGTVPVTIHGYLESGKPAQQGVLPYSVSVHLFIRLNSGYNNPIRPQRKLVIRYLQLIKKACPTGNPASCPGYAASYLKIDPGRRFSSILHSNFEQEI